MTLSWKEPMCTKRNGITTGYTYSFQNSETSSYIAQDEMTNDTQVTFPDLSFSTLYTFSVSANTRIGKGPAVTISSKTGISI